MAIINYDKSVFNLLGELAQINSAIFIQKNDDGEIYVNAVDNSESVFYNFIAKEETFEFAGDECFMANFPEFHRLVNMFDSATVDQSGDALVISQGNSKIDYRLTNSKMADDELSEVDFDDQTIMFKLNVEDIDNIKKMIGSVVNGPDGFALITVKDTDLTLQLGSSIHDNSYTEQYEKIENPNGDDIELKLGTDIFTIIPRGDYEVSIDPVGLFKFKLLRADASVDIYTGILQTDD